MVDRTLVEFVKEALAKGAGRAEIEAALKAAGWPTDQAHAALAAYAETPFGVPAPAPRAYVSAREAFLYLVLFILLGVLVSHLGALLFTLIDVFLPRDAPTPYAIAAASGAIRWSVSALTVALPLYLVLTWRLWRLRRRSPAMQGSRIRKWLTYLTLVIAATTLIGDLIAVVYNLLAGELTLRFFLKASVIGGIAGAVFTYYVRDAERDEDSARISRIDLGLGAGVTATALIAAIVGVSVIESPATVRGRERDDTRLTDLADIAGAVDCYTTYEDSTPDSLEAMRAALDGRASTTGIGYSCSWSQNVDPATGAPYEYRPLSDTTFELCATFDRASSDLERTQTRTYSYRPEKGPRTMNVVHPAGRHCFTLEARSLEDDDDTP